MSDKGAKRKGLAALTAEIFAHRVIIVWLPILYLLISSLFYLRTYDSAQVKITMMQMGGLALLVLWVARLLEAGGAAFTRQDLVCLSPFLAYLGVGIFSFIHAPYNMASVDFFLRHFFFMSVALIVIYEFDDPAAQKLTRWLIRTAWIAVLYGFVQFIDIKFFMGPNMRGPGRGLDPFIWRGAFGERVFSTYGNPNFFGDFLVIVFPIILTQYVKSRQFSLLPLMAMLLIDLVGTQTKGAWLGMAMVLVFTVVISLIYFKEMVAPYRKALVGIFGAGALWLLVILAYRVSAGNIVSINFRLFTWEGTWEMIRTQPLIGTGVGSFPPIYPAFRRPPIFHIEGKHNTETDHSENEYLEQLFDNGILGFGIFLWLLFSTLVIGFRSLGQLTTTLSLKDGRPPPRAFDIAGYIIAFMGMLGHNFTDVSLRFVSSGVYMGLLSGMIVNLARGKGLYELHELRQSQAPLPGEAPVAAEQPAGFSAILKGISEFLIWPARGLALIAVLWICGLILKEFTALPGPSYAQVMQSRVTGEIWQWWLSWGVMGACVLGLGAAFVYLIVLSQNPLVPLVILAAALPPAAYFRSSGGPMYWFWGYFKADVHHNMAIFHSKERRWEQALQDYYKVNELNPNFVMALYFMGNVYNDRFDMRKINNPAWGDKEGQVRDDYERALDAYDKVRRLAPNYVQMHHQVGNLHLKRAEWALNNGRADEAPHYMERAMTRYKMYQAIDPVFSPNYYRIGQIYMWKKQFDMAAKVYEENIRAEKCQAHPKLVAMDLVRNKLLAYQQYAEVAGESLPVHRHETAEGYWYLGNAYFMQQKFGQAEAAYKRALEIEPGYELAKKNLGALYQQAQAMGRKIEPAVLFGSAGASPSHAEFEITSKK